MLKIFSITLIFTLASIPVDTPTVYAESERLAGAYSYIKNGAPKKAISISQQLLSDPRLKNSERKDILELIAEAERIIAKAQRYEDVSNAVQAIESLIKEFPEQVDQAKLTWDIAQLYWHQKSMEQTQATILDLQSRFPGSEEARSSWLTLGKVHFTNQNYAEARNAFLRFALTTPRKSQQGREARMWTALVDYEEQRYPEAFQSLWQVFNTQPKLITDNDSIYMRYILLLDIQQQKKTALKHADKFLSQFKKSSFSPRIRLLRADLMLEYPKPDLNAIIQMYGILADRAAGTVIGRQAFMRKMMLQTGDKKTYREIKPVIIALKRIANQNQMSEVEDEAFLHEAMLWHKVASEDSEFSPKTAVEVSLQQFTHAASSTDQRIAKKAQDVGNTVFKHHIKSLIKREQWLAAIALWEHYPNFRPPLNKSAKLRFNIARGLHLLMEYEQAETILKQLHDQAGGSVWGEKVMLERARLWLNRSDPKGEAKIMQWLSKHEYTLYRPEMLVVVAHMQLRSKNPTAASHTLEFISPEDLAQDIQAEFWEVTALTAEALSRWHVAARAWRMYAKHNTDNVEQARLHEANALFKGKDYLPAERLYAKVPQDLQSPTWQYRYSICQLRNGKWNQAIERLTALKADPNAGIYASMASLTLAEREAERLLEKAP